LEIFMNATLKSALLGAAVLGLTAGANIARADDAKPAEPAAAAAATCVEKNSCKGHGSKVAPVTIAKGITVAQRMSVRASMRRLARKLKGPSRRPKG
jgi:hypothetical protein